jgi:hypothetical protein
MTPLHVRPERAPSPFGRDPVPLGQGLPWTRVPGVRLVPADEEDVRALPGSHRRASSQTFRRTTGSQAASARSRGRRLRRVQPDTMPVPGITDS